MTISPSPTKQTDGYEIANVTSYDNVYLHEWKDVEFLVEIRKNPKVPWPRQQYE